MKILPTPLKIQLARNKIIKIIPATLQKGPYRYHFEPVREGRYWQTLG